MNYEVIKNSPQKKKKLEFIRRPMHSIDKTKSNIFLIKND